MGKKDSRKDLHFSEEELGDLKRDLDNRPRLSQSGRPRRRVARKGIRVPVERVPRRGLPDPAEIHLPDAPLPPDSQDGRDQMPDEEAWGLEPGGGRSKTMPLTALPLRPPARIEEEQQALGRERRTRKGYRLEELPPPRAPHQRRGALKEPEPPGQGVSASPHQAVTPGALSGGPQWEPEEAATEPVMEGAAVVEALIADDSERPTQPHKEMQERSARLADLADEADVDGGSVPVSSREEIEEEDLGSWVDIRTTQWQRSGLEGREYLHEAALSTAGEGALPDEPLQKVQSEELDLVEAEELSADALVELPDQGAVTPVGEPGDVAEVEEDLLEEPTSDLAVGAGLYDSELEAARDTGELEAARDTGELEAARDTGELEAARDDSDLETRAAAQVLVAGAVETEVEPEGAPEPVELADLPFGEVELQEEGIEEEAEESDTIEMSPELVQRAIRLALGHEEDNGGLSDQFLEDGFDVSDPSPLVEEEALQEARSQGPAAGEDEPRRPSVLMAPTGEEQASRVAILLSALRPATRLRKTEAEGRRRPSPVKEPAQRTERIEKEPEAAVTDAPVREAELSDTEMIAVAGDLEEGVGEERMDPGGAQVAAELVEEGIDEIDGVPLPGYLGVEVAEIEEVEVMDGVHQEVEGQAVAEAGEGAAPSAVSRMEEVFLQSGQVEEVAPADNLVGIEAETGVLQELEAGDLQVEDVAAVEREPEEPALQVWEAEEIGMVEPEEATTIAMELEEAAEAVEVEPEEVGAVEVEPEEVAAVELEPEEVGAVEVEPEEVGAVEVEPEEVRAEEEWPGRRTIMEGVFSATVELPEGEITGELEPEEIQAEVGGEGVKSPGMAAVAKLVDEEWVAGPRPASGREAAPPLAPVAEEDARESEVPSADEAADLTSAPPPLPGFLSPFERESEEPDQVVTVGGKRRAAKVIDNDEIMTSALPLDHDRPAPAPSAAPPAPEPPATPAAMPLAEAEAAPVMPQAKEEEVTAAVTPLGVVVERKRKRQWYEEVFNEDWLHTVPTPSASDIEKEGRFIEETLKPAPESQILEVGCGDGSYTIFLARRGYRVTGFDISLPLLIRAADRAQRRGVEATFLQGDFREIGLDERFDAAYCLFTRFGYYDDEANRRMIQGINRSLKVGGRFLLGIVNRDYAIKDLPARIWREANQCVVLEEVDFDYFTSRINSKRTVVFEDGRHLEQEISVRAYSLHEVGKLLHHAGFRVLEVTGHMAHRGIFFGSHSRALVLLAEKRQV